VPNVDVEMSRQRHWPLPEPRARFSFELSSCVASGWTGVPTPNDETPPWGRSKLRSQKWFPLLRSVLFELATLFATDTALPPGLSTPREAPSVRAGREEA